MNSAPVFGAEFEFGVNFLRNSHQIRHCEPAKAGEESTKATFILGYGYFPFATLWVSMTARRENSRF